MRKDYLAAVVLGAAAGGALAALAIYQVHLYGWTLFFGAPVAIGFVASAVLRLGGRRPVGESILCTCIAALIASLGFLLLGKEGIVCVLLAIPLASPFLLIGALAGYLLLHRHRAPAIPTAAAVIGIVGTLILAESHSDAPVKIVEDSVIVHASSADVWKAVVELDAVPTPKSWMYRLGLACPQRARIESARVGGYRLCTLSTGQLVEQIDVWQPQRTLRWHALATPPPMHELNPFYPNVDAPHLHGYYDSPRGEFALERLGPSLTRLTRRTWYSQRLYPNAYWGFFCELAISQIHRTVLGQVQGSAETRV